MLFKEAIKALTAVNQHLEARLPIREIRISLLDADGEGVGLFVEYDEETGELERGMQPITEDEDDFLSELENEFNCPPKHLLN